MMVSAKGRYALRLMVDLALHDTGIYISLRDISRRQNISVKYLEQIAGVLSKAGLVRSVRGSQGGYRLARRPEDYTAGEVLRAVEGTLAPVACLEDKPNLCPRYKTCSTISFWEELYGLIDGFVNSKTLRDLAVEGLGTAEEAE